MRFLAVFLVATMLISVTNSYAITVGNSEVQLPDGYYASGMGIIQYQRQDTGSCTFAIPNYSVKSVNSTSTETLNLSNFMHSFFIVLGNHDDESYDYLQIGLPEGSGLPSYFLDLKDDEGKRLRGEFYSGYDNLAVVVESGADAIPISEDIYMKYFTGESKDITSSTHAFGPGNYTFGAFLLKSNSAWVNDESCVLHLEWPFAVNAQGDILALEPSVEAGRLVSVTEEFSPLKQHRAGVNPDSIYCKPGLRVILQQTDESGNKRPACVTPATKAELVERGWTKDFESYLKTEKSQKSTEYWNSLKLMHGNDNLYCNSNEGSDQCYSLEDIVFGNARKSWKVFPGAGVVLPENSPLAPIYKNSTLGLPQINLSAMLDDEIFVNKCESNGGTWNYNYHDCEGLWAACRDAGGIVIQEDVTPPCTDTGASDDDSLTSKACLDVGLTRVSCVFEYEN